MHINKTTFQKCIYIRKCYTHVTRFQHYKTIFLTIHFIEIFSCLPLRVCKRLPGLSFVTIKHVYRSNVYLVGLGLHLLTYQETKKNVAYAVMSHDLWNYAPLYKKGMFHFINFHYETEFIASKIEPFKHEIERFNFHYQTFPIFQISANQLFLILQLVIHQSFWKACNS